MLLKKVGLMVEIVSALILFNHFAMVLSTEVQLIGLYSLCKDSKTPTSTNIKALIYHKTIEKYLYTECFTTTKKCKIKGVLSYQFFDVCDDYELLAQTLLSLQLNSTYFNANTMNNNNSDNTQKIYSESNFKILTIITYLQKDMNYLVVSFHMQRLSPVLVILNPDDAFEEPTDSIVVPEYDNIDPDVLIEQMKYFQWMSVGLILLNSTNANIYENMFNTLVQRLSITKQICIFWKILEADDSIAMRETAEKIKQEKDLSVLYLFGSEDDQREFLITVSKTLPRSRQQWILIDIDKSLYAKYYTFTSYYDKDVAFIFNHNRARRKKWQLNPYISLSDMESMMKKSLSASQTNVYFSTYENAFLLTELFKMTFSQEKEGVPRKDMLIYNKMLLKSDGELIIAKHKHGLSTKKYVKNMYTERINTFGPERKYYPTKQCKKFICSPGWTLTFDKLLLNNQTQWNNSLGWTCMRCQLNHVKETYGEHDCSPCTGIFVSNQDRTHCYDPYKNINLSLDMISTTICLVVTFAELFGILFIGTIFYSKRKTPICHSTNLAMTAVQMTSQFLLLISLPPTFFWEPSNFKCFLRPLTVSVFYTINMSIIFTKSRKMLQVFNSNVKLTNSDMRKTSFKQFSNVLLFLLISNAILSITFVIKPASVGFDLIKEDLHREYYCNTDIHIQAQFILSIVFQLLCLIPAYKSRSLPDVFSEAMSILYTSFITTFSFLMVFPIYYFQQNRVDKTVAMYVGLLVNNGFILLLLYGKRIYMIIFHSHKNTIEHFREKSFQSMRSRAESSIPITSTVK